jgi:hypothetical protein
MDLMSHLNASLVAAPESSFMMSAERTNNSGAELAGCPSCAQPMRLISKDNALATARSVHLRIAEHARCYTPRSVRTAAIARCHGMNDSVTCPDHHLSDNA